MKLNLVGLCTDKLALEYLKRRGIKYLDVRDIEFNYADDMPLDRVREIVQPLSRYFKEEAFNFVIGGFGGWHHFNLGIIIEHYNLEIDVVNIDNHTDTEPPDKADTVYCGSHHHHLVKLGRKVVTIRHEDGEIIFLSDGMLQGPDVDLECVDDSSVTLEGGLQSLTNEVYLTMDIDAIGEKHYKLSERDFSPRLGFGQGTMSVKGFLYYLEQIYTHKQVVGGNMFGLCNDKRSFGVYDQVIGKMRVLLENCPPSPF